MPGVLIGAALFSGYMVAMLAMLIYLCARDDAQ